MDNKPEMPDYICPICQSAIQPQDRQCSSCGVDLMLATRTTERAILGAHGDGAFRQKPVSPEVLVPRLGEHLVRSGYLSLDQLEQALDFQMASAAAGTPILIGQALLQMGFINQSALDSAVTDQIFQLHNALQKSNVELEEQVEKRSRDLQNALNRLSELNQIKANFIANISHELRTPLTHIKGYAEMLHDSSLGPITSEQAQAFEIMLRSIGKLEMLINDLIRSADTSREELKLHLLPAPPKYLIQEALNRVKNNKSLQHFKFLLSIDDALPNVICDQKKISWVFLHLVDNAVKFTPNGGVVKISASRAGNNVRFSVEDTGIGIEQHRINEIFEPFHQLDASSTRKFSGTGLGLTIVKSILDTHGVDIEVESHPGKGTRFTFHLPANED